jgi:hypothetical protein
VLPFGQATGLKSPRPEARGPQDNARGEDFAVLVLYFEPGRLSEILLLETWLTANHETTDGIRSAPGHRAGCICLDLWPGYEIRMRAV